MDWLKSFLKAPVPPTLSRASDNGARASFEDGYLSLVTGEAEAREHLAELGPRYRIDDAFELALDGPDLDIRAISPPLLD